MTSNVLHIRNYIAAENPPIAFYGVLKVFFYEELEYSLGDYHDFALYFCE